MKTQIILASASPRRRELLDQIGVSYQVSPVDIDETPQPEESARHFVRRIAAEKSAECLRQFSPDIPVLAADTTVVLNRQILGKPKDAVDAEKMLQVLSAQTHQVYTAISLRCGELHQQAVSITEVTFKALTLNEIRAYWRTGEPVDKAGSYAIQGLGAVFVESIQGSYSGVMGLPLFETAALLQQQGIQIIP
jgi:septum formation protein